jgi:hypothetical protein
VTVGWGGWKNPGWGMVLGDAGGVIGEEMGEGVDGGEGVLGESTEGDALGECMGGVEGVPVGEGGLYRGAKGYATIEGAGRGGGGGMGVNCEENAMSEACKEGARVLNISGCASKETRSLRLALSSLCARRFRAAILIM